MAPDGILESNLRTTVLKGSVFGAIAAIVSATSHSEPASAAELRRMGGQEVLVERIASGVSVPWGLAFLDQCEFLVTERRGNLLHFDQDGQRTKVTGVPIVYAKGQGGLLDVVAARDFSETRRIFLSYAKPQARGQAGTALAAATLSEDGSYLSEIKEIFEVRPGGSGGRHFGSRIVEDANGFLFLTTGERGNRPSAQDLGSNAGKIVRIHMDGEVPADNPFVMREGARPEIWSLGHRNPQGAALDASEQLWVVEHGARGGDEINKVEVGLNYGWPVISYGTHYSGAKIGVGVASEGMEQPEMYWDPSIAPSGMMIYSGELWPEWRGQFFVGSLKFDFISRIDPAGSMHEVEQIDFPETRRVRDVREAPDGSIWFLSEDRKSVYRIAPATLAWQPDPECAPRSR